MSRSSEDNVGWSPPDIGSEEIDAVVQVLKSGWLAEGKVTRQFEADICKCVSARNAVIVNNGTSALVCALLAHGIGRGDEVVVPTHTFIASINSVLFVGAKPVLVDCDAHTFNTTTDLVARKITEKTKAIMVVDVAGMPCDIESFRELAGEKDLVLIEDAAEALGARYRNRMVGSYDHTTILSFHMAKTATTVEGGCVLSGDEMIARKCRLIKNHGMQGRYDYTMLGLNLRTTDLQSSIGRVQLQRLEGHLQRRQEIARIYKDELNSSYEFQHIPEYVTRHPYMIFYLLARDKVQRDAVIDTLSRNNVGTRICWPPTHVQPYHQKLFDSDYPNSDDIYARSVALPMGNGLTLEQATYVARLVKGT